MEANTWTLEHLFDAPVRYVLQRSVLNVREDCSVEFPAASPVPSTASASAGVDELDAALCQFVDIKSALASLEDEVTRSEIKSWISGPPVGPIPLGYSNPALVEDLQHWKQRSRGDSAAPASGASA